MSLTNAAELPDTCSARGPAAAFSRTANRARIAGGCGEGRGVSSTVGKGDGEPFNPTGVGGGVEVAPAVAASAETRTAAATTTAVAGRPARARRRTGPEPI